MVRALRVRPLWSASAAVAVLTGLAVLGWYLTTALAGADSERDRREAILEGLTAVYLDPGDESDVVSIASAEDPTRSSEVIEIPHSPGWRLNGSVSPEEAVLAAVVNRPGASSAERQAELVVVDLLDGSEDVLGHGYDVRGPLVWSDDGTKVVVRRSDLDANEISLWAVDVASGAESELVSGTVIGLYPLALEADGTLYYVLLDDTGSHLYRGEEPIVTLSDTFSRDWVLSPERDAIAFIETRPGTLSASRVVAFGEGARAASAGEAVEPAVGAAWGPGHETPDFGGGESVVEQGLPASEAEYFEAPEEWSPDGAVLALTRYFGRPGAVHGLRAEVRLADGTQLTLGDGRVVFLGWFQP